LSKPHGPRVLYWDIETSLMPVTVFQLGHNDYINPQNILQERYVICACWSWNDESKVHSVSVLDDPKRYKRDSHDDTHVIKTLHKVLSEADIVVHHKGDSFDLPYVKGRALVHGLNPLPPVQTVDTYKVARSQFFLPANSLDYLGKLLKVGRKIHTDHSLWMRVFNGESSAVREMITYNKQDVRLLRDVYKKLLAWAPNHPNLELYGIDGCPKCGHPHVQSRGIHKAISRVYRRFQCQGCGGWFKAETSEKTVKTKRRAL